MSSNRPAPAPPTEPDASLGPPTALSVAIAAVIYLVPGTVSPRGAVASGPRRARPLGGRVRRDSGWYAAMASEGCSYVGGRRSTVALFPARPVAMRALAATARDTAAAVFGKPSVGAPPGVVRR